MPITSITNYQYIFEEFRYFAQQTNTIIVYYFDSSRQTRISIPTNWTVLNCTLLYRSPHRFAEHCISWAINFPLNIAWDTNSSLRETIDIRFHSTLFTQKTASLCFHSFRVLIKEAFIAQYFQVHGSQSFIFEIVQCSSVFVLKLAKSTRAMCLKLCSQIAILAESSFLVLFYS